MFKGVGARGGARKKGHQQKDIDRGLVYNFVILSYGHFKDWKVCSGRLDKTGQYISIPRVSPFSRLRCRFRYQANLNPFFNLYFTVKSYYK